MNLTRYKKILGWAAVAGALVLPTSCKDDTFSEFNHNFGDEVKVSFTINPEAASTSTRAINYNKPYPQISDGSKANMLLYAVYEVDDNDNDILLEDYGNETVPSEFSNLNVTAPGKGQTMVKVDQYPYTLNLMLKKNVKYRIAFWAQNPECKAYRTTDLRKVEVVYSELDESLAENNPNVPGEDHGDASIAASTDLNTSTPNNDERRDAFCRSVELKATTNSLAQNVYLYRPLAQINVGTNGYDYEIINRERIAKYTYSKIRINRVARYLDVVKDKTYTSTTNPDDPFNSDKDPEAFAVVDYGYAPIPAYNNYPNADGDQGLYDQNNGGSMPLYPTYTKWDWIYGGDDFTLTRDGQTIDPKVYKQEEFLKVKHLERDNLGNIKPSPGKQAVSDKNGMFYYKDGEVVIGENGLPVENSDGYADYANLNDYNDYESETYKYLSMCYVLTSSTHDDPVVINNIKVWLATDANGSNEFELFSINSVPAQRNWRTNIVGNLLSVEKYFQIKLDTDFAGEYSGWGNPEWEELSGQLAAGVYYDAEHDEIQISSVEGLVWFQQMVNGDMRVRVDYPNYTDPDKGSITGAKKGEQYPYYKHGIDNSEDKFDEYKFIEKPSDEKLRNRILVATHQKWNLNSSGDWPANSNFHFTASDEDKLTDAMKQEMEELGITRLQATVRLMADLDLGNSFYQGWIPIGFDAKNYDTIREGFAETNPEHRGFCGIFDGNNHSIANVSTKRFTAAVHEKTQQRSGNDGPYDNLQWFARGFFGQLGGDAWVKDLTLFNVDIYGCNGVGGIAGIACGRDIRITGCTVDGGELTVTPMYRGDTNTDATETEKHRTYARGVYLGGIVGYFYTKADNTGEMAGEVDGNSVRNVTLKGYRRVGGLIGSLGQPKLGPDRNDTQLSAGLVEPTPRKISNNSISNTTIIASGFSTFGLMKEGDHWDNTGKGGMRQTGFGWEKPTFGLFYNSLVGGYEQSLNMRSDLGKCDVTGNSATGVTTSKFEIICDFDDNDKQVIGHRRAVLESAQLKDLPMLSSWYVDDIELNDNYYGEPSAYKYHRLHLFKVFSKNKLKSGYSANNGSFDGTNGYLDSGGNEFLFPMDLPLKVDIDWVKTSPRVGLYIESVKLTGKGIGGRSVVTPNDVDKPGAAAVFVCPRNRHQFRSTGNFFKKPTVISNMVIRGEPFAYTGLLLAPNKNMLKSDKGIGLQLNNVAIYDCYQTIATDDWQTQTDPFIWPHWASNNDAGQFLEGNSIIMELNDCNLRGYTVPGPKWAKIDYNSTTFEQGGYYKEIHGDATSKKAKEAYTNKVECPTKFYKCFFKAPYIIDLTSVDNNNVTFDETNATSTSTTNCILTWDDPKNLGKKARTTKIVIRTDNQGNPTVSYYEKYDESGHDNVLIVTESAI